MHEKIQFKIDMSRNLKRKLNILFFKAIETGIIISIMDIKRVHLSKSNYRFAAPGSLLVN